MTRRRKGLVLLAIGIVLSLGLWALLETVNLPAARARRLVAGLRGEEPSRLRRWMTRLCFAEPPVRTPEEIVDELAAIGAPAVPVLIEVLQDKDPAIGEAAADALGRIGPSAAPAVPALIVLVKDPGSTAGSDSDGDWHVVSRREYAIRALGRIGPSAAQAVPVLIDIAESSAWVCGDAENALVSIGPPAVGALVDRLVNPSNPHRDTAKDVLAQIGAPAVGALIPLLRGKDEHILYSALQTCQYMGPPAALAVPAILTSLDHSDPGIRSEAILALGKIGPATPDVVPALVRALDDQLVDWNAVLAIGAIGPPAAEAVKPLVAVVHRRQDRGLSEEPVLALGRLGPRAAEALVELLKQGELYAVDALPDVGPPAVPLLVEAAGDKDEKVRLLAAVALGRIGAGEEPKVVGPLIAMLKPADGVTLSAPIRRAVAMALRDVGPPAAAAKTHLRGLLTDESPEVRTAAALALVEIDPDNTPADLAVVLVDCLQNYLARFEDRTERKSHRKAAMACRALGILGPPVASAAGPLLASLGHSEDEHVRAAAHRLETILQDGRDFSRGDDGRPLERKPSLTPYWGSQDDGPRYWRECWYPPSERKLNRQWQAERVMGRPGL